MSEANGKPPATGWYWLENGTIDLIAKIGRLAFCILAVIARFAGRDRVAEISPEKIGEYLGVSGRSIRAETAKLAALEIIEIDTGRGRGNVNRYTLKGGSLLPPFEPERRKPTSTKGRKGGSTAHERRKYSARKAEADFHSSAISPFSCQDIVQDLLVQDKKGAACAATIPAALFELMHGWNALGNEIVKPGNGVKIDRPSKAVLAAWKRRSGDSELHDATEDITALLGAVRRATFCHRQGWFTLPWLFGRNKNGELNAPRLLAGAFDQAGNGKPRSPVGTGQRHPADLDSTEGTF